MQNGAWLEPLRRELDAAHSPRTFFFRDDDAGWANERLLGLLDLFAHYSVPLDLAVIPAALDDALAASLRRRATAPALLGFHQHGLAHENHERSGCPCEFGPARTRPAQLWDIEAGARRLCELLGRTEPIFTPPWNRCTRTTADCLLDLGFQAVARDSSAERFGLPGLRELAVHVDWSSRRLSSREEVARQLAVSVRERASTGVMLHHALMGSRERDNLGDLLALLTSHANARCVPLASRLRARAERTSAAGGRRSAPAGGTARRSPCR
jgi:hypothetical protein